MIGFGVFVAFGISCLYLLGYIKGPSLPLNAGASFALIIVTAMFSLAGLIGAVISLFR